LSRVQAPVFFIHAANDYSLNPGKVMDERLAQLKKPHRLEIYPPIGRTPDDGHAFPLTGVRIWESDVFAFLSRYMQP
jgi:pimeloyl-ACP methyl ester carboxylesterase